MKPSSIDLYGGASPAKNTNYQSISLSLFKADYTIEFKSTGKKNFITYLVYYSKKSSELINAYLNLLLNRSAKVADRISIKELDFFMRTDPKIPFFNALTPEHFKLLEIGEIVKKKLLGDSINRQEVQKVFNEDLHGPYEFMSLGERFELFEEVFSHQKLIKFNIECLDVVGTTVIIGSKLVISDLGSIQSIVRSLVSNSIQLKLKN